MKLLSKAFTPQKRRHVARLHQALFALEGGMRADHKEVESKTFGRSTGSALKKVKKQLKMPSSTEIDSQTIERINTALIAKRFSSRTQIGKLHGNLIKVGRIAKLNLNLGADLKSKRFGPETSAAIKVFQKKYKLAQTGVLNQETLERIESVVASRPKPKKRLKVKSPRLLNKVRFPFSLNKVDARVNDVQRAMAYLGKSIDEKEFKTQTYGKTTRDAVRDFQKEQSLVPTGKVDRTTARSLNAVLAKDNPSVAEVACKKKHRVRGSIRDALWQGDKRVKVQVFEKKLNGEIRFLAENNTLSNGFFDIVFDPPVNTKTGQRKKKFSIVVKAYDSKSRKEYSKLFNFSPKVLWANFTAGKQRFAGDSEFAVVSKEIHKALGTAGITDLGHDGRYSDFSQLSNETGLAAEDVFKFSLAHRIAGHVNTKSLSAAVFYSLLRQNIPSEITDEMPLFSSSGSWQKWIAETVEQTAIDIVLLDKSLLDGAIKRAIKNNLLPRQEALDKAAIRKAFDQLRSAYALEKPILASGGALKDLLDPSLIASSHYAAVADRFAQEHDFSESFFNRLSTISGLKGDAVRDFQKVVQLGQIAQNHMPTVRLLNAKLKDSNAQAFKTERDFAKLNVSEWEALLQEGGQGHPANLSKKQFAIELRTESERLFPSVSLLAEVKRTGNHGLAHIDKLASVIDQHPDFDLRADNLTAFTRKIPNVLNEDQLQEAKAVQRIHRIAPSSKCGAALLKQRLHSAQQVYFCGRDRLVRRLGRQGVGKVQAVTAFQKAEQQYAKNLAMLTQYRFDLHHDTPQAIAQFTYSKQELEALSKDIPDLATLFGSLDHCECKHCQSVYGPAAYLTDLLRFLEEKDAVQGGSVKDVLFRRRPDLGNIKLSCANTDTAMPYIDLVCEVLENQLPPAQVAFQYQTTLSPKELRATPEYTRTDAYNSLKNAWYPIHIAFNLWQEQTRVFLNHLGVPRYELMEAFQVDSHSGQQKPSDASIAAEYFGISSQEMHTICDETLATSADQSQLWNLPAGESEMDVSTFLERSKLTYNQLVELLQCRFVTPGNYESNITPPADDCDVSRQKIVNLNIDKYDRMYRFLRLWRRTDWQMGELDAIICNPLLGNDSINESCLINLWRFQVLQRSLGLSVEDLLCFYGQINTEQRVSLDGENSPGPSLYHQLFLNPTYNTPPDSAFTLPLTGEDLISEHSETIMSAFAITRDESETLLLLLDNDRLNLHNLSVFYRHVLLARKFGLSIAQLLRFTEVCHIADPFASPDTTATVVQYREDIVQSGFCIAELEYLLRADFDSSLGLRDDTIVQKITALRNSLSKLRQDLVMPSGDQQTIEDVRAGVKERLEKFEVFTDDRRCAVALDLIEGRWQGSDDERRAFITDYFAVFVSCIETAIQKLTSAEFDEDPISDRYEYIIQELWTHLNAGMICEQIASLLSLSNEQARLFLNQLRLPGHTTSLLSCLQDNRLIDSTPSGDFVHQLSKAVFPEIFAIFMLLHKLSLLVSKLPCSIDDLTWLCEHHDAVDSLDFSELPSFPGQTAASFESWRTLWRIVHFKNLFPEPEHTSLFEIIDLAARKAVSKNVLIEKLSALTTWSEDMIRTCDAIFNIQQQPDHGDFTDIATYERLLRCHGQMRRTAVSAQKMFHWADRDNEGLEEQTAKEVMQAAKARYSNEEWLDIVAPLQDALRERKRNALVEYLIERSQREALPERWQSANDLFNHFLIDVEMSPCGLTSRIKQAISSVQLFIQRCFLNLESRYVRVPTDDPDLENSWSQWKWMKNYRIWEANRKVFLYPENWIEPELRDDKSPFFVELENDILQNEVTQENVEAAFLNYLEKVEQVARLNVCAVYHEEEGSTDVLHVVARTRSVPPVYYYRCFDLNYSSWSAWEKIEADIASEQIVPVVYNRRLYVFWLLFHEKPLKLKKTPPAKATADGESNNAADPPKVIEIELAWTSRWHNGWKPKQISQMKLIHPWQRPTRSYNMRPRYVAVDNTLRLDLYISTSREFNEGQFYDQFKNAAVSMTRSPFNETFKPWHSSCFVFDGDVVDVKLRSVLGQYYMLNTPDVSRLKSTNSYKYVKENFGQEARSLSLLNEHTHGIPLPTGMHYEYTRLVGNSVHTINTDALNILEHKKKSVNLLRKAKFSFEAITCQQEIYPDKNRPRGLFYQDSERIFFIRPKKEPRPLYSNNTYSFHSFYHPYIQLFQRELKRDGIDGLFKRDLQLRPQTYYPRNDFKFSTYRPAGPYVVADDAEADVVDFSHHAAYSLYNWELFFHAPLMVACRLSQNQRFEEAMRWFHYIFDPTNVEDLPTPQRYWITKPFFQNNADQYRKQRIQNILQEINKFSDQIVAWKNNPFSPHLVARYRPIAYQRMVVMKYIDNLIAWADQLFRRDSMESVNEATLLYVLAHEILGPRPRSVPAVSRDDKTFNELGPLDPFGNTKVDVLGENVLPTSSTSTASRSDQTLPKLELMYFGLPHNEKLLTYWDTVEDRLFKIRHCMNIEGAVRQLPLFEPPIDPAILVKAAAAGVDLGSVLDDLNVSTPQYRFRTMASKAMEFVAEVRSLAERLLQLLEKKDAEALNRLRVSHEIALLEAAKKVRENAVFESVASLEGLEKNKENVELRRDFYQNRDVMIAGEKAHINLCKSAGIMELIANEYNLMASIMAAIPDFDAGGEGFGASPVVKVRFGGSNITSIYRAMADGFRAVASTRDRSGNLANTLAGYKRRQEEWNFQRDTAAKEIEALDKQIEAAKIRQAIAEYELENHRMKIEDTKAEYEYLQHKYTNEQLYAWMLSQITAVYFSTYQMAYDMAKRAEKSFQRELGLTESAYIRFGYWDSLKKGLMAADKLAYDLRRMEAAYLEQNRRELEITKNISLKEVAPWSLIQLKYTGRCSLDLEEWLFDMDYPGHYMRRIKSIALTIPCVATPYMSVNCTLSLDSSDIRTSALIGSQYQRSGPDDKRFLSQIGSIQRIATSHGRTDSGLFSLNFADERFLPFEGSGVISRWVIDLPKENNQFDFSTLSDVILHIQYTARDGGQALAIAARDHLAAILPSRGVHFFAIREMFPYEWNRFLHPLDPDGEQKIEILLKDEHFPFYARGKHIELKKLGLAIDGRYDGPYGVELEVPKQPTVSTSVTRSPELDNVHYKPDLFEGTAPAKGVWKLKIRRDSSPDDNFSSLDVDDVTEVILLIAFTIKPA